ncbi:MAG: hypothetical protein ABIC40_01530 [bacterium]
MGKRKSLKRGGPVKFMWVVIVSLIALVLFVIIPAAFKLAMKAEFNAARESVDQWQNGEQGLLRGALSEQYSITSSIDYKASFIPGNLTETEKAVPMTTIEIVYGPLLIAGSSIQLSAIPVNNPKGFAGKAVLGLKSVGGTIVFMIMLLLFLLIVDFVTKDPNAVNKFAIGFTLTWLIYAIILWAMGDWITKPFHAMLNMLLTPEQGEVVYKMSFSSLLSGPVAIFVVSMLYRVLSLLIVNSAKQKQQEFPTTATSGVS